MRNYRCAVIWDDGVLAVGGLNRFVRKGSSISALALHSIAPHIHEYRFGSL